MQTKNQEGIRSAGTMKNLEDLQVKRKAWKVTGRKTWEKGGALLGERKEA